MNRFTHRIRQPVKRDGADTYLLIMLLSFAAAVSLTRLFLAATGYPQLGGGQLHIAHVLWGGLILFAAALLPLILANRWVYNFGALLAGVGVGLFIDEIGKFITQTNDYFFPAAAPLIYAFFLLVVLLYGQVRRPPARSARAELYRAFEALSELLDHDLEEHERADLEKRLKYVAGQAQHPDLSRLARELLVFVRDEEIHLAPSRRGWAWHVVAKLSDLEDRWLGRVRSRAVLAGGMLGLAMLALSRLLRVFDPSQSATRLEELITFGAIGSPMGLAWYSARIALEASVGGLLLVSALLLLLGMDRRGIGLGYLSLLLSLTAVNLLVFYFDQFVAILTAAIQFLLLVGVIRYRARFLSRPDSGT